MSPKAERFVQEYLCDLNATQAAIRAGYSPRTAAAAASRLLSKVNVRSLVEKAAAARSERTQIDADWVLRRLQGEAEADMADLYDANGNLLPIRDWPMVFRKGLVVGVEVAAERDGRGDDATVTIVRKIKLQDRTKTVELIGKHVTVGAFRERVEHSGTMTLEQMVAGSYGGDKPD